jgi:hypothetical protein
VVVLKSYTEKHFVLDLLPLVGFLQERFVFGIGEKSRGRSADSEKKVDFWNRKQWFSLPNEAKVLANMRGSFAEEEEVALVDSLKRT